MDSATKTNFFEENPNQNARIAFVVWTAFDYYVYKNIARHLPESEFVVCNTWFKPFKRGGGSSVLGSIEVLKKHNEHWRVIKHIRLDDQAELKIIEKFFEQYDVIVALRLWPPIASTLFNLWLFKKKSVLVNYGVGKDLVTFAPWVALFDIVLADGPHTHKYFRLLSDSYLIGVPKYDDWFSKDSSPWGKEDCCEKYGMDPSKKTILFLPTHSIFSSLHKFNSVILDLTPQYNVLIKFHYLNQYVEKEIMEKIRSNSRVITFDERDDLVQLMSVSDVIVSDSSSAGLEAVLIDKPLVILDTNEKHTANDEDFNGLWHSSAQMYMGSIEQRLKDRDKEVGPVVVSPDMLASSLVEALDSSDLYKKNRKKFKKDLFAFNDGKCGQRAAYIIRKFMNGKLESKTPLLGMAIRSYFSSKSKDYQKRWAERSKELEELKRKLSATELTLRKQDASILSECVGLLLKRLSRLLFKSE